MIRTLLAVFAAALAASAQPASANEAFLVPRIAALEVVHLAAPTSEKSAVPTVTASGLLRIGDVRALEKSQEIPGWTPAAGGFVTRFRVTSDAAVGLRVRLDLGVVPGAMSMRVQGSDLSKVESMDIDPTLGPESWTPWTEGDSQVIEIYSRVRPSEDAVRVGAVLHMVTSPLAKAGAASCTISTACSSDDPTLDGLIDERRKSVAKIQFVRGGSGFLCSATLVDTPRRPQPYLLTANHCIDDQPAASSMISFFFYESAACGNDSPSGTQIQVKGGAQLVYTSFNIDSTLLLLNNRPPDGTQLAPLNPALMAQGTSIVSLSHPHGDTMRWGTGTVGQQLRDAERPYDMYSVNFNRGIIEPGSSGSGVFTAANGHLELRGVLSQGDDNLSCSQPTLFTLYTRLEALYPEIAPYIGAAALVPDDAPNRPQDVTTTITSTPLDLAGSVTLPNQRIDFAGDVDVYKFTLASPAVVTASTSGSMDTVSVLLDGNTHEIVADDDAQTSDTNTGITQALGAGTYYYSVAAWTPSATGSYGVTLRADRVDATNHTALWWNANESGWGLNINHQGNILFGTLFTYNANGTPLWLVMSKGDRQVDGSYSGTLYQSTGPVFNAQPWTPNSLQAVGTMTLAFTGDSAGALTYTYNGKTVNKAITKMAFRTLPTCSWSSFDRSFADNFQDLWWNPNESGWGVNLTHQQDVIFATLFTYNAAGQALWFSMSDGEKTGPGQYSGALYTTAGPAFNASPWTSVTATQVGNMSFNFKDGNTGTMTYTVNGVQVTKSIQRMVFSNPKTQCEQ